MLLQNSPRSKNLGKIKGINLLPDWCSGIFEKFRSTSFNWSLCLDAATLGDSHHLQHCTKLPWANPLTFLWFKISVYLSLRSRFVCGEAAVRRSRWSHRILNPRSSGPTLDQISSHPLKNIDKCHIYLFFEPFQGWWLQHFPGEPVTMLNHSFSEEFSLIWGHFPLSCRSLGEEPDSCLAAPSCQAESNMVFPEPSFHQNKLQMSMECQGWPWHQPGWLQPLPTPLWMFRN